MTTHKEALKHLKAITEAFGPDAGIELDQKAWAKLHAAIKEALAQPEQELIQHCEAGPEYCWKCNEEIKPTYGSEEIRKLREVNKSLNDHIPDATKMVAKPEQEPTNLERHERNVQKFLGTQQPKEPEQDEYLSKAYRLANELRCHLSIAPAPQRTWVGLTPDEIRGISLASGESLFSAIMFTHDKLRDKNT